MNIHCLEEVSQSLNRSRPASSFTVNGCSFRFCLNCLLLLHSLFIFFSYFRIQTSNSVTSQNCSASPQISFTSLIKQVSQDQNGFSLAKNGRQSFGCLLRLAGIIERCNSPHLRPYYRQDTPCSNQTIESTYPRPLCVQRY